MQEFYIHRKHGGRKLSNVDKDKKKEEMPCSSHDLRHCTRGRFTSRSRIRCESVARSSSAIAAARRWCSRVFAGSDASSPRTTGSSFRYLEASDPSFSETSASDARVTRAMIQGLQPPRWRPPPITGASLRRWHLHAKPMLLSPSDTDQVTVHLTRIGIQPPSYGRILERIAPAMTYADLWARE